MAGNGSEAGLVLTGTIICISSCMSSRCERVCSAMADKLLEAGSWKLEAVAGGGCYRLYLHSFSCSHVSRALRTMSSSNKKPSLWDKLTGSKPAGVDQDEASPGNQLDMSEAQLRTLGTDQLIAYTLELQCAREALTQTLAQSAAVQTAVVSKAEATALQQSSDWSAAASALLDIARSVCPAWGAPIPDHGLGSSAAAFAGGSAEGELDAVSPTGTTEDGAEAHANVASADHHASVRSRTCSTATAPPSCAPDDLRAIGDALVLAQAAIAQLQFERDEAVAQTARAKKAADTARAQAEEKYHQAEFKLAEAMRAAEALRAENIALRGEASSARVKLVRARAGTMRSKGLDSDATPSTATLSRQQSTPGSMYSAAEGTDSISRTVSLPSTGKATLHMDIGQLQHATTPRLSSAAQDESSVSSSPVRSCTLQPAPQPRAASGSTADSNELDAINITAVAAAAPAAAAADTSGAPAQDSAGAAEQPSVPGPAQSKRHNRGVGKHSRTRSNMVLPFVTEQRAGVPAGLSVATICESSLDESSVAGSDATLSIVPPSPGSTQTPSTFDLPDSPFRTLKPPQAAGAPDARENSEVLANALAAIPLFSSLNQSELQVLKSQMEVLSFSNQDVLHNGGMRGRRASVADGPGQQGGDALFVVVSGTVALLPPLTAPADQATRVLTAGEWFVAEECGAGVAISRGTSSVATLRPGLLEQLLHWFVNARLMTELAKSEQRSRGARPLPAADASMAASIEDSESDGSLAELLQDEYDSDGEPIASTDPAEALATLQDDFKGAGSSARRYVAALVKHAHSVQQMPLPCSITQSCYGAPCLPSQALSCPVPLEPGAVVDPARHASSERMFSIWHDLQAAQSSSAGLLRVAVRDMQRERELILNGHSVQLGSQQRVHSAAAALLDSLMPHTAQLAQQHLAALEQCVLAEQSAVPQLLPSVWAGLPPAAVAQALVMAATHAWLHCIPEPDEACAELRDQLAGLLSSAAGSDSEDLLVMAVRARASATTLPLSITPASLWALMSTPHEQRQSRPSSSFSAQVAACAAAAVSSAELADELAAVATELLSIQQGAAMARDVLIASTRTHSGGDCHAQAAAVFSLPALVSVMAESSTSQPVEVVITPAVDSRRAVLRILVRTVTSLRLVSTGLHGVQHALANSESLELSPQARPTTTRTNSRKLFRFGKSRDSSGGDRAANLVDTCLSSGDESDDDMDPVPVALLRAVLTETLVYTGSTLGAGIVVEGSACARMPTTPARSPGSPDITAPSSGTPPMPVPVPRSTRGRRAVSTGGADAHLHSFSTGKEVKADESGGTLRRLFRRVSARPPEPNPDEFVRPPSAPGIKLQAQHSGPAAAETSASLSKRTRASRFTMAQPSREPGSARALAHLTTHVRSQSGWSGVLAGLDAVAVQAEAENAGLASPMPAPTVPRSSTPVSKPSDAEPPAISLRLPVCVGTRTHVRRVLSVQAHLLTGQAP